MPIIERDPWRMQYFEQVACPENVVIPTDDEHAYALFPDHRWIYNKLLVCDTQGFGGAPHGVPPPSFPVFSKPIYNMHGMGVGGRVINSEAELNANMNAGYMWMTLAEGEHVSSDVVVIGGEAQWWRHSAGKTLGEGVFDYWTVLAADKPEIEQYCGDWLRVNLKGYSGAVNLETIGGKIIEVHLRFADQWPDLYGEGWIDAIVELYARRRWRYADTDRRDGYSVVLFGAHGVPYRHPPASLVDEIAARPGVTSVQITFHEDLPPEQHAMPPGGFRLAIVNCWQLEAGLRARADLALAFWSTQSLGTQRHATAPRAG
ncbi:MAG: hypothetical protein OEN02_11130 [Gammaproteobacteria bacterium]|nr:hypothetical protein [Gammaproteobacteria bacterium]MDH3535187.1 hypothetical protein [Gammaproteobacteria bacterium]